jgi:hypothetical protein
MFENRCLSLPEVVSTLITAAASDRQERERASSTFNFIRPASA